MRCACLCARALTFAAKYSHYLQITHSHVVEVLMLHYKNDLVKVLKELRLPYNIDVLARIRRDCFQQNFSDPNSLHHTQVHVRFTMSMENSSEFSARFCPFILSYQKTVNSI